MIAVPSYGYQCILFFRLVGITDGMYFIFIYTLEELSSNNTTEWKKKRTTKVHKKCSHEKQNTEYTNSYHMH